MESTEYKNWPEQVHRSDGRIVDARDVLKILGIEFMSPYGGTRTYERDLTHTVDFAEDVPEDILDMVIDTTPRKK